MLVTLVLVVRVIFVFLLNGSATVIPSLALPFAVLGTFAVMAVLQYSLDTISMMALILAITFVVDDAIVMLENIVRHVEQGADPYRGGARRLQGNRFHHHFDDRFAVGGLHPSAVHGGLLGRLFREFAVTITTAILISGVVSITLTPMLCSRFLNAREPGAEPCVVARGGKVFPELSEGLRVEPARRATMAALCAGVLRGAGTAPGTC